MIVNVSEETTLAEEILIQKLYNEIGIFLTDSDVTHIFSQKIGTEIS